MAPIRRYLRITKYSVLEVRVYLDNPALAQSWLLNPRNPVLPRVIESVRPLVLPKLREEQERDRNRKKSSKKRSIKDVVIEEDFEVSIFLTETPTRHSLLHKQKLFRDKTQTKLKSNSSKLTGGSLDSPIDVDTGELRTAKEQGEHQTAGVSSADEALPPDFRREADDDEPVLVLDDIPTAPETDAAAAGATNRGGKRRRGRQQMGPDGSDENRDEDEAMDSDRASDELFVGDSEESDEDPDMDPPPSKRQKDTDDNPSTKLDDGPGIGGNNDDKKKLAMDISYEGFAIYGRVLCLVVKRRDIGGKGGPGVAVPSVRTQAGSQHQQPGCQASMENWITSTQLMPAAADDLLDTV